MIEALPRHQPELVWNKGIAALCDRRIPDEFPDGRNYSTVSTLAGAMPSRRLPDNLISDPTAYRGIADGELVWVRLSWLKSFVKQVYTAGERQVCVSNWRLGRLRAI